MSTAVHRSPNKLLRSNAIFKLCCTQGTLYITMYELPSLKAKHIFKETATRFLTLCSFMNYLRIRIRIDTNADPKHCR
jgi:hypothetical protein